MVGVVVGTMVVVVVLCTSNGGGVVVCMLGMGTLLLLVLVLLCTLSKGRTHAVVAGIPVQGTSVAHCSVNVGRIVTVHR